MSGQSRLCSLHRSVSVPSFFCNEPRHAMIPPAASVTEQLALRLQRPVEAAARQRAALLLVDWLGCALAPLRYPLATQLRSVVQAQSFGPATALGLGGRSVNDALLLNGALGN